MRAGSGSDRCRDLVAERCAEALITFRKIELALVESEHSTIFLVLPETPIDEIGEADRSHNIAHIVYILSFLVW